MLIKIDAETYMEPFNEWPSDQMIWSGWSYRVEYFLFGLIPVIFYTKTLFK